MSQAIPRAAGVRIGWSDLPSAVHAWAAEVLGSRVTSAVSQPGGFSPGSADRVVTANGDRAFVKAVSPAQNPHSPNLHRQEGKVTGALPPEIPAAKLLGQYDDGTWAALALEDVDGRHPATPWAAREIDAVLVALEALARSGTPAPPPGLKAAGDVLAEDFGGWARLAADRPHGLDPWVESSLGELDRLAHQGLDALAGETLCHLDVRADNLLLRPDGSVAIVDWPWACRASPWFDSLCLLLNVEVYGGHDPQRLIGGNAPLRHASPEQLTAALAGLAGYFLDVARRPPSVGLPTVRAFQRAQGDAAVRWLRRRLEV